MRKENICTENIHRELNMAKVLFIGDTHLRYTNPMRRIDNYFEEIKSLILQSLNIAKDRGCESVIFLGDIFDKHDPHMQVINDIIDILKIDNSVGASWPFKIYAVIGNHDLKYHNAEMLDQTAIGTLSRTCVRVVNFIKKHSIYCGHYRRKIEFEDFTQIEAKILALHAYILPKYLADLDRNSFVSINEFKVNPMTKIVITGHYHDGYGIIKRGDGVVFVNSGSLTRCTATKSNIERDIKVTLIDTDTLEIEEIVLDYIPGEQIFDLIKIEEDQQKIVEKKELAMKLDQMRREYRETCREDPINAFKEFAKNIDISNEALELVIMTLEETKKEKY